MRRLRYAEGPLQALALARVPVSSLRARSGSLRPAGLRTMRLGAWAALLLGALQVLALPGAAGAQGSTNANHSVPLQNSSVTTPEIVNEHVTPNRTGEFNISTTKPSTTSVSVMTGNVTVTVKPSTSTKMSTPRGSLNVTSTALKSTSKAASVSPNTTQMSTTTAHSTLLTLSATTIHSEERKGSRFDTGSFVGGIVLTLGVLSILYIGCKVYYSRRGIRYRSIDEHDAII